MSSPPGIRARWGARAGSAVARLREEERGAIGMIELLIAGTAAGVVFAGVFSFLLTGTNRLEDTEARRTTLSEEQIALDRMAREIREAETAAPRSSYSTVSSPEPPGP